MRRNFLVVFILLSTTLLIQSVYAAPMLYRIQQMKEMKQRQAQEQYQAEYQQYQQNQAGQQASQSQAPQLTPEQLYDQQVDERNQAIAKAISGANVSGVSTPIQATASAPGSTVQMGDTVDLTEVWKKLDNKSTIWTAIDDNQAKLMTVTEYIGRFEKEGVKINEPPQHYVQMIDQMSAQNPQMLQRPFGEVIQMMAIIDYDFDNGMDKDLLAKKVLGDDGYAVNQKRLQEAQQQSQQQAGGGGQGT